jgi:hypothetical protein
MTSRSIKDLSLDELEKMIHFKKEKSVDHSKLDDRNYKRDSFLKESIQITNGSSFMPQKQFGGQTSALQIALKEMQTVNKDLDDRVANLEEQLRYFTRVQNGRS